MTNQRSPRFYERYVLSLVLMLIIAIVVLFPMIWTIMCSFQPDNAFFAYPPQLIPKELYLENYRVVLTTTVIPQSITNSLIVCAFTCAITLFLGAMTAFALSRTKSRYKSFLTFLILTSQMIPPIILVVPIYVISNFLKLLNTRLILILVYSALNLPLTTIILRGFYDAIPKELDEVALLDGCSRFRYFLFIAIRLVFPGLAAMGVLVFVIAFNEFVLALTLITSSALKTYQLGLYEMLSTTVTVFMRYGYFNAATSLGLIPVLVLYLLTHRKLISGLAQGAIKE